MDISTKDKAKVLATLYNASKAQGMGILHFTPENMSVEEARQLLNTGQTYFDYLKGRVMKIDLSEEELITDMYNRDNGVGAAERALAEL